MICHQTAVDGFLCSSLCTSGNVKSMTCGHSCSSSFPTSMALETSDISVSEVYTALGISELRKCSQEPPRVLSIISSLLEKIVQRNEKTLDNASRMKEPVTIFHGMRPPALGIRQYIDRIFRYASCSPSCFVLAHLYIERFLQKSRLYLTSLNVHRLLITSVVVATKFIDDSFFNNVYYAKVGGISTAEMNRLELKFLFGLDFRLYVSVGAFGKHCVQLEKEASGGACQIERSILACRLNDWTNAEEVKSQQRVQCYSCGSV